MNEKLTCLRCGHTWFPRQAGAPICCASCGSPYWNKPRKNPNAKEELIKAIQNLKAGAVKP